MKKYDYVIIDKYENQWGCFKRLEESSLSRIWKHGKKGFFIMSAFRGIDEKKNALNHKKLKQLLKEKNLGYFEIDGQYKYDDGTVESELSVFVPYRDIYSFEEFKEIGKNLGKEFNQESILVKYPEGNASLVYPDSSKEDVIGSKVGFDKVSDAYSKLRKGNQAGRSFIIEGYRIPDNHVHAISLKRQGVIF
jgi:hypothetical protein